jgi:hypothetical protein
MLMFVCWLVLFTSGLELSRPRQMARVVAAFALIIERDLCMWKSLNGSWRPGLNFGLVVVSSYSVCKEYLFLTVAQCYTMFCSALIEAEA